MSTVIRAGQAGKILNRLSTVDLADHLDEARVVIDEAKRRAAQLVAQAEARAAEVLRGADRAGRETGYREGHAEGVEAGRRAALDEARQRFESEHSSVVDMVKSVIAEVDGRQRDLLIAAERNMLEFAVAIAGKLTFEIGLVHREAAVENFKRALRHVAAKTHLTIRANPVDIETLKTFAPSLLPDVDEKESFRMEADETLSPGGCCVESDRTRVDASLETQVGELVSLLLGDKADHV